MGILDYIYERDADRVGEFHHHLSVGRPVPPERHPCPYDCPSVFKSLAALLEHARLDHPTNLPALALGGRTCPELLVVRTALTPDAAAVLNAETCTVRSGRRKQAIEPGALSGLLADFRRGRVKVELSGTPRLDGPVPRSCYTLDFRVADPQTLAHIEACFLDEIPEGRLSTAMADRFHRKCRIPEQDPASEYAGAFADFIIGSAIKERQQESGFPDTPTTVIEEFSAFERKFTNALAVLREIGRALSTTVAALIRFNFNDFREPSSATGVSDLDLALTAFREPGRANLAVDATGRRPATRTYRLQVDHITGELLRLASGAARAAIEPTEMAEAVAGLLAWDPLGPFDRKKLLVLQARALLHLDRAAEARAVLGQLRYDVPFGPWAEDALKRLS